jgi:tryptophan-rich hypothetical protein
MNNGQIHPKKLLNSHWTKVAPSNQEKHFPVVEVEYDEQQRVVDCQIEAAINNRRYSIDWRSLKDRHLWKIGWQ